jgi:choline monooxygenase
VGPLRVDPDIRRATTLPGRVYTDAQVFDACRERVFRPSWQLVTDTDRMRAPGQALPFMLLEGMLDEPLLLTRDRDDRLHCLSNVCTHRGHLVADHEGIVPGLRCRYHGRRFGLDGCFQSMPEFEGVENFPSPADSLPRVAMETLEKLVFVSLGPGAPFADLVAPVRARCGGLPWDRAVFDPARSREYAVQANWALYVENYLEGFHIPYVHAGLAESIDYGEYRTERFEWSNLQLGIARGAEDAFELPASSPDAGRRVAAYYFWLFPNTMLNLYPWGVSVNIVRPLAVDRTRVSFLSYVWAPARLERGAGAALDRVEREDEVIVEAVQKGLRCRLYAGGRFSPAREQGVHHFQTLLARALDTA